ncbi:MAG TPA: transcription-repair coupling factor [Gammaproteobacteria bacterium]|nr:transcription-repair coupling factor [Gammaproteobacteria bacterium]
MNNTTAPLIPNLPRTDCKTVRWGKLYGSSVALALAHAARTSAAPMLVVAPSAREAEQLVSELGFYLGADGPPVLQFPDWETLPYDLFSPHQDILSQRLAVLAQLPALRQGIVVTAAATLLQRLPPQEYVLGSSLLLNVGEKLDPGHMRQQFTAAGYASVSQVMEHGEFAVRGALLDIFPMGSPTPFRIDLFDDEIESIRRFDPETQLSGDKLDAIRLLPAREFPLDETGIRGFRQRYRARFEGDPQKQGVYRDVSNGLAPGGIEYFLPLFFERTASLFEYLPTGTLCAMLHDISGALDQAMTEIVTRHEQRCHDLERPLLRPEEAWHPLAEIRRALDAAQRIEIRQAEWPDETARHFATAAPPPLRVETRAEEPVARLLAFLSDFPGRVLFAAESAGRREHVLELLSRRELRPVIVESWQAFLDSEARIALCVAPLERGLLLPDAGLAIVAEEQLFGQRARQATRRISRRDPASIIRDLTDLGIGAPVVHEEHGVGRYLGLQMLDLSGIEAEFLALGYAGGDKLYVPVSSLHLVTRYTGSPPETAPLHRLGGDQWQKARRRAAEQVRDVAAELLDIHARRAARRGHAFTLRDSDYRAFVESFPFDETEDQLGAINGVLSDMTDGRPMDRVVCGDVGFGKTEVAVRAAFIAAQAGKQVAMLVPTTLLAQQHYQTFRDRFADWPMRIEVLSRFRTGKQHNEVVRGLASGSVDIVIGTHALLRDELAFKDLGLVIVDEEHRFGVRHKERLKKLRAEVDMLTLTATPIPRTLNMSLAGLRDLSIIATPPAERLAVKTFVSQWQDALIQEACLREIKRGGQVYFMHNSVDTIQRAAENITRLVPGADVRIAHGQMHERELEQVMLDFYHRRFNVLVCTTIIESGIDVPTANTIIIDRADKLGLAQLHQLRGRVGRSHHRAYAYLITPPRSLLTPDAVKRLDAIESLEELGAGFTLATHDLEIRGAGELLGEEQSGQIHEVGFTLYTELLERTVRALKEGRKLDLDAPLEHGPEIDLHIPALLPADYMPDVHLRLTLYKRIAGADDAAQLRDLQVEMIDRFGLLPAPAKTLFRIAELKLKAAPLGVRKIEAGPAGGRIVFGSGTRVEPATVIRMIQQQPRQYRLDGPDRLRFTQDLPDDEQRLLAVEALLDRLAERAAAA